MTTSAFIALGSNMGDSENILRRALERLAGLSARPLLRSSFWQTTPVDCPPGSPPFINAVVRLTPLAGETPESLLAKLQQLEREFGRKAKLVRNEPRRLDLDLICFGSATRKAADLTLPHPRASQRRFVLQPLAEIAPGLILAGEKKTVQQLLNGLESREVLLKLGT